MSISRSGYYKWKYRQEHPTEKMISRQSDIKLIKEIHEAEEKVDSDILNLMNTLLSSKVSETEKKRVMQEDFNIIMTEELESEVSDMCNLSQGIWDSGIEKGKKEQAIETALKMIARGKLTLEEIAEDSGLTLEEVKELADKRTA